MSTPFPFEDLDLFLNPMDGAVPLICPDGARVMCLWTDASVDNHEAEPMAWLKASDVAAHGIDKGAKVRHQPVSDGEIFTYTVMGRDADGSGGCELKLRKD